MRINRKDKNSRVSSASVIKPKSSKQPKEPKELQARKDPQDKLSHMGDMMDYLVTKYQNLETSHDQANNIITALNARISIRNEMISGYFEKHIEDCRRQMKIYKTNSVEYKMNEKLIHRLMDIRREVFKT